MSSPARSSSTVTYQPAHVPLVVFEGFRNPQQQASVEATMKRLIPMLPYWVARLRLIHGGRGGKSTSAQVCLSPEYRTASITVFDIFFDDTPEQMYLDLKHEVVHIFLAPITDFVEKHLLKPLKDDDEALHARLEELFNDAVESATQQIAYSAFMDPPEDEALIEGAA